MRGEEVLNFDFIVVGAGIAGASAAAELADGYRVALIERESRPGYHTTGRSAAVYLKSYGNAVIKAMTAASEAFYHNPDKGFSEVPLLHPRGMIMIARQDQLHRVEEELTPVLPFVADARRLDGDEIRAFVPQLRKDYVAGGFLDPQAEDMDVDAILQGFLRRFRKRGGQLLTDSELTGLEAEDDGWRMTTRGGELVAPVVINAAGAWADEVAKLAGLDPLGLIPKRRTAFIVDPPKDTGCAGWPVIADIDEQFYFRPESGGLFCSPADETPSPPCDAQPEELDVAIAADRIMKALDIEIRHIRRSWAGLRTFAPDKTPIVGFDPRARGFFWLAGQGGYGIQTAPAMAALSAALASGTSQTRIAGDIVEAMNPQRLIDSR
ncbi:MAG: FAD-binding oxidoreductase [Geminicoccaceae bacterium]|nr:FAD-binding oxidoreductase [Geminicoccaceae bacterium]